MYKDYKITSAICALIIFIGLPNRFQMASDFSEHALLILSFAEPILHIITYNVVGVYYRKGVDTPVKGSILYLVFFYIHTGLFYLIGNFGFSAVAIVITVVLYIAAHIGFAKFKKFLFGGV